MKNDRFRITVTVDDLTTLLWDRINRRYCRFHGPDRTGNDALMVFASPVRAEEYFDILARTRSERKTFRRQYRPRRLPLAEWLNTVQKLQQEGFKWFILHTPEHCRSDGSIGHAHIAIQGVLDAVTHVGNESNAEEPRWVVDGQHRHGGLL